MGYWETEHLYQVVYSNISICFTYQSCLCCAIQVTYQAQQCFLMMWMPFLLVAYVQTICQWHDPEDILLYLPHHLDLCTSNPISYCPFSCNNTNCDKKGICVHLPKCLFYCYVLRTIQNHSTKCSKMPLTHSQRNTNIPVVAMAR